MMSRSVINLSIMMQGTASDVGKSVLVAGLCRIFMQDGYRCTPFKSQNMALNLGIILQGEEMGRAQIFQAEAAGIVPNVRMNPVLLKPTNDRKAQVVLMGKVACNRDAVEYHQYKPQLQQQISCTTVWRANMTSWCWKGRAARQQEYAGRFAMVTPQRLGSGVTGTTSAECVSDRNLRRLSNARKTHY